MGKRILVIDDDTDILDIYRACFKDMDYIIETAENGLDGLEKFKSFRPDLIILDIMMPKMNGFEFCAGLRKEEGEVAVPIIFASAGQDNDKPNAFSYGVVDYMVKPFRKTDLINSVAKNIDTGSRWSEFLQKAGALKQQPADGPFLEFLKYLAGKSEIEAGQKEILNSSPSDFYLNVEKLNIQPDHIAESLAEFYKMKYFPVVDPESVQLGLLPVSFLQNNRVVATRDAAGDPCFILAEPFNEGLVSLLKSVADYCFAVTEPANIDLLFDKDRVSPGVPAGGFNIISPFKEANTSNKWESTAIMKLSNVLLSKAMIKGENSILIEPRNPLSSIRFGQQKSFQVMAKTGGTIVSRYKILSGLDAAENKRPQKGGFKLDFKGKRYNVQVSTIPITAGENCAVSISAVV